MTSASRAGAPSQPGTMSDRKRQAAQPTRATNSRIQIAAGGPPTRLMGRSLSYGRCAAAARE